MCSPNPSTPMSTIIRTNRGVKRPLCTRDNIWLAAYHIYHPQTKFAKVKFLQVCVCPQRGGIPACLAAGVQGVVSQHALQVSRPTPKGEV